MALGNNSNAIFLSIADGKIVRRVQEPTNNSRTRVTKTGKTVHEELYNYVEGYITDIRVREHQEFGKFWAVQLADGDQAYQVEMKYSSGYASSFLKALPNVDLNCKVKLSPKQTIEGDKKKTTLFVNQMGTAVKHFYTKDNPNGLPRLQQVKVKGVLTWDDTEMMEFLEEMVKTTILPKLTAVKPATPMAAPDMESDDDMPF